MVSIENYNFKGKNVIVRVDFNVPLDDNFKVTDNTRLQAAVPTIKKIINSGGNAILMSHMGRPKTGFEKKYSLMHVVPYLSKLLDHEVLFAEDCIGEKAKKQVDKLSGGEVLLLENLRFHSEEKKGDKEFAKKLAELADVYVNDAFGSAHRAHASTAIIAEFFPENKLFGYLMENEIKNLDKVIEDAKKPFTAIIGGAKVSSKIDVIMELIDKADNLIIGGGMTYTFVKAKGGEIGGSMLEEDKLDAAGKIIQYAKDKNVELYLPIDNVIAKEISNDAEIKECGVDEIEEDWKGLDIGQKTVERFSEVIKNSSTILWNGPMGVFEKEKFANGTKQIALAIASATEKGAYSLIGGGDSVAAVKKFGLEDKASFISTGGGAMLEYIEGKKLPGIKAIKK